MPLSIFRITLIGLLALALAMGIGRFAFTPLLPIMQQDGLANITDGGLLTAIHFFGYWLGAASVAKMPCSPKMLLRCALLAIAVSTLGMGITNNFTVWLLWRWLAGVASAWILVLISNYYVKHLADSERTAYQGWIFSGVGAGIAIVGLGCLIFMVNQIDSSSSWQIIGACALLAGIVIFFNLGPEIPTSYLQIQRQTASPSPLDWRIIIAYGVMGMGYIIPATYLPVMAREIVQSPLIFGWSWPVFGAAAFVSTILAARLQQYYSNRQLWAASHIVMAFGLILPVIHQHIVTIIVSGLCVGGTFMIITMVGMKEAHRIAPSQEVMRYIAVMTASFAIGQMIGPVLASIIYTFTQSFAVPLTITSVALIITATTLVDNNDKFPAS